jgi:hypothetical protein
MLNRSKIVTDVDSFIRAHLRSDIPQSNGAAEPHPVPKSRVERPRQLLAAHVEHAPHRTEPFPSRFRIVTFGLLRRSVPRAEPQRAEGDRSQV